MLSLPFSSVRWDCQVPSATIKATSKDAVRTWLCKAHLSPRGGIMPAAWTFQALAANI